MCCLVIIICKLIIIGEVMDVFLEFWEMFICVLVGYIRYLVCWILLINNCGLFGVLGISGNYELVGFFNGLFFFLFFFGVCFLRLLIN